MLQVVASPDLRKGMFVSKLDRPWLESPFLLQGFVIEDDEQLAQLREICRHVVIDRTRSVGFEYRAEQVGDYVPEYHPPMIPQPAQGKRKLKLPPMAQGEERDLGGHKFVTVHYADDIPIEDELPAARVAYKGAQNLLRDIAAQVEAGMAPDVEHVERTVDGLVECVVRNADALVWLSKLKRTDTETYDHSLSASIHLMAFGRYLGLPPDDLHTLGTGGLLKDIGFIRLPADLVHKEGGLMPGERARMREHVKFGCEILADGFAAFDPAVRDIILKHHERIDGSGYPDRLDGEHISLFARMGAVCDIYDAITSNRPYKRGWDPAESIRRMTEWSRSHFDVRVFQAFVKSIGIYPTGSLVRLTSGRLAVVTEQSEKSLLAPRVKVFFSTKSQTRIVPETLDLAAPGMTEKIVGHEDPAQWGFNDLDAMWTG